LGLIEQTIGPFGLFPLSAALLRHTLGRPPGRRRGIGHGPVGSTFVTQLCITKMPLRPG
jgi:hypothetical protein